MSEIDSEIQALRARINALEEQKAIRVEKAEKERAFPLETLEAIIHSHRSTSKGVSNKFQQERWRNSQEKLVFLEPIFNMLVDIQKRLEVLENA
jgi:hypothetical protein